MRETEGTLSAYEQQAQRDIQRWREAPAGLLGRVGRVVGAPVRWATERAMDAPGVGRVLTAISNAITSLATDAAAWSVRPDAVLKDFQSGGHAAASLADIRGLDLAAVDDAIGYLAAKYKVLAAAEGGSTGALGAAGIVADIPAVMVLSLRAIGEYATYCGFDINHQGERQFAMEVLAYASGGADQAAKVLVQQQLQATATKLAKRATWKTLEQEAFVRLMRQLAQEVGVRLTKAKLAQVVPVAGGVVGAGVNTWFMAQVCDAAFHLYRERFLAEKAARGAG